MDINCDLGEGIGNDQQIMPFISSCNIACGVHAGSLSTMKTTVLLAKKHKVKVGAHPSFPDRENFGRTEMFIPKDILRSQIINQISSLKEITDNEGVRLHHVKPHGALYNMATKYNEVAMAIIEAIQYIDKKLILYVPYGSLIARKAKELMAPIFFEAFADRSYDNFLNLVSRTENDAIIVNSDKIFERVQQMIEKGTVISNSGKTIKIKADTICVHGDNPNAFEIVKKLSEFLKI
ncbi:MAG: 5-oxoprolinase subunit PxpA [Bacteroidota bacterium]